MRVAPVLVKRKPTASLLGTGSIGPSHGNSHVVRRLEPFSVIRFWAVERECFGAIAQMCVCTDALHTAFDSLAQDKCEESDIHENT